VTVGSERGALSFPPMSAAPVQPSGPLASVKEKGLKYLGVSVINVVVGQTLLLTFHAVLGWPQAAANALAVLISAFPAYYLSRKWVWGKSGKSHFKKEVLPFWIFVGIGLVFSTAMVALGAHLTDTTGAGQNLELWEKLLPNVMNAASFFILWIIRFFLMEKLFQQHPELAEELVGEDFIIAVEGQEKLAAAEAAAAERAGRAGPAPQG
jgi:putative flippase GtrA